MAWCCSSNPFAAFISDQPCAKAQTPSTLREKKRTTVGTDVVASEKLRIKQNRKITKKVAGWLEYVHPRVYERFKSKDELHAVLMQIAKGLEPDEDPLLPAGDGCVCWLGDVVHDSEEPMFYMQMPEDATPACRAVKRMIVFCFADDESFAKFDLPPLGEPVRMMCGNQSCTRLDHIALST